MSNTESIPNHYTAKLSELDLRIAISVPPGGNWKDIPTDVPSKRLESIREGFAAGSGSRSTYYGRLHPERPSYTINTYYNRPGNGCHLHYDFIGGQHRVLSEREAARLQSFPDTFLFHGSHTSIQKQIGNAVPPLLAYQIVQSLPFKGQFADLFSGAGGLSLGAKGAGWSPIVANDIEPSFLDTYRTNVHPVAVSGDIRDDDVFQRIVETVKIARNWEEPLFVIGGPPCQGFSTAGNRRSLDDKRNHLFNEFKLLIDEIRPDGFIFENVMGLLSMNKGQVFEQIKEELTIVGNKLIPWILKSEEYGIPQRRTRLVLLSVPTAWPDFNPPKKLTALDGTNGKRSVSASEALGDLPKLRPGEDGSRKAYLSSPQNPYQKLMRGDISVKQYLETLEM